MWQCVCVCQCMTTWTWTIQERYRGAGLFGHENICLVRIHQGRAHVLKTGNAQTSDGREGWALRPAAAMAVRQYVDITERLPEYRRVMRETERWNAVGRVLDHESVPIVARSGRTLPIVQLLADTVITRLVRAEEDESFSFFAYAIQVMERVDGVPSVLWDSRTLKPRTLKLLVKRRTTFLLSSALLVKRRTSERAIGKKPRAILHTLKHLMQAPGFVLQPHQFRQLAVDLVRGVAILEAAEVAHRDLNWNNVLVYVEGSEQDGDVGRQADELVFRLKICDFGMALYYGRHPGVDHGVSEHVVRAENLSVSQLEHLRYGINRDRFLRPEHLAQKQMKEISDMALAMDAFSDGNPNEDHEILRREIRKVSGYDIGPRYIPRGGVDAWRRDQLVQQLLPYEPFVERDVRPAVQEIIPPEIQHAQVFLDILGLTHDTGSSESACDER